MCVKAGDQMEGRGRGRGCAYWRCNYDEHNQVGVINDFEWMHDITWME